MHVPIWTARMIRHAEATMRNSYRAYGRGGRPEFECARLTLDKGSRRGYRRLSVQAADGFRLVRNEYEFKSTDDPWAFTVTLGQVKAIRRAKRSIEVVPHLNLMLTAGNVVSFDVDGTLYEPNEGYGSMQPDYEHVIPTEDGRSCVSFAPELVREDLRDLLYALPRSDRRNKPVYTHIENYANANAVLMALSTLYDTDPGQPTFKQVYRTLFSPLTGEVCTAPAADYLLAVLGEFQNKVTWWVKDKQAPMLFTGESRYCTGTTVRVALMPMFVGRWTEFHAWAKEQVGA